MMNLTKYSTAKFKSSLMEYGVPEEYQDVTYNYLVHGYSPGSFFTALFANDAMGALGRSHPSNSLQALKNLITWIINNLPPGVAYGSYEAVNEWLHMPLASRRAILEDRGLIYTSVDEVMMVLKESPLPEPTFSRNW